jgi:hypothetical protein
MTGQVLRPDIGFDLHDPPGEQFRTPLANEILADQIPRDPQSGSAEKILVQNRPQHARFDWQAASAGP